MRGFRSRLNEWRMVSLIIAVCIAMAIPHLVGATKDAIAAMVVSDFNAIMKASMAAYAETQVFPASGDWGEIPDELALYLPRGFSFTHKKVVYRWRRWSLPSGSPKNPSQKILVGLQVRTEDPLLLGSIIKVYQGRVAQIKENQVTFVIL